MDFGMSGPPRLLRPDGRHAPHHCLSKQQPSTPDECLIESNLQRPGLQREL